MIQNITLFPGGREALLDGSEVLTSYAPGNGSISFCWDSYESYVTDNVACYRPTTATGRPVTKEEAQQLLSVLPKFADWELKNSGSEHHPRWKLWPPTKEV